MTAREAAKKILRSSPLAVRQLCTRLNEMVFTIVSTRKERAEYGNIDYGTHVAGKRIRNILIYHVSGLSFGGTEKNLQAIANMLADEYKVFFMFSNNGVEKDRSESISENVTLLPFEYDKKEAAYPYFIHGMKPHFKEVIAQNKIDLVITADSGHSQYPFNALKDIPIVLINIFGSPSLQGNVVRTIYISEEVKRKAEFYTGPKPGEVLYIPSQSPLEHSRGNRAALRTRLGIPEEAFVFGRIGRDSDSIFDPIGIRAFQKIVQKRPRAHYLIMSPAPELLRIVAKEKIPNVHMLPPSSAESDIWDFHYAIDCLAHFRMDGESCGLNIAESMMVGNPIISHRSNIWNAHTEYLNDAFARVAPKDDADAYASYMEEFISIMGSSPAKWASMREASESQARKLFSLDSYRDRIKAIISSI